MSRADEPAFPVPGLQTDVTFNGLSKREYFAAMAMQGILAGDHPVCREHNTAKLSAVVAVDFADSLLRELEKPHD